MEDKKGNHRVRKPVFFKMKTYARINTEMKKLGNMKIMKAA